jgi:aminopeptidase N
MTGKSREFTKRITGNADRMRARLCGLSLLMAAVVATLLMLSSPARAADKPTLQINSYIIDADLEPVSHHLTATVQVNFTTLDATDTLVFQLHNALKVNKVTDGTKAALSGERGQDATIRITPHVHLTKGQTSTYTFQYDGTLSGAEDGPVEGLKLTSIGDPISYLLYAGRWFPMTGYLTNRFSAEMHIRVPSGYRVIGSGSTGAAHATAKGEQFDFNWTKPGFPGTIIAGKFEEPVAVAGSTNIRVYTTAAHHQSAADYAQTANRQFAFFTDAFGIPESSRLNIVELPNDTVPATWAPEIAAIAGSRIGDKSNSRLLANSIARQWWGSEVSPATLNDAWITYGMSRYAELMNLEEASGNSALTAAVLDVSAGALAYDTIPLSSVGRQSPFSPEFQSMTLEKGAMVFHMLRWEVGDENFKKILRGILSQFAGKSVRTADVLKVADAQSGGDSLTPFFAQWLDGTGAPLFTNKYTVYRLGNNKGFRTIGQIDQDLDLFRMPVELRVDTDGKTESKRVDVVGTDSQYIVDTFGRPRRITIDPRNWVLKNSPDMQVRVSILRGQQMVSQGQFADALAEYQKALTANANSSLASYRVGEVLFTQRNYQASANAYRDALRGDADPKWTEVWSHIQLGKIFDVTGQRDRAVNEYRQAVQTNDNTQGALNEARKYLQTPFKREETD